MIVLCKKINSIAKFSSVKAGLTFKALADYITDREGQNEREISAGENFDDRVKYLSVSNCENDDYDGALAEIVSTQALKPTIKPENKSYHLVVSFRQGETVPDKKTMDKIEHELLKAVGLEKHQRISAFHVDTEHPHLHVAVNRLDPENQKLSRQGNDYYKLVGRARELEKELGLESPESAKKSGEKKKNFARITNIPEAAKTLEVMGKIKSFAGWAQQKLGDDVLKIMKDPASKAETLQKLFDKNGVHLEPKGAGLMLVSNDGKYRVKASMISRSLSKAKLGKKFSTHEFLSAGTQCQYKREPLAETAGSSKLWDRYKEYKKECFEKRSEKLRQISFLNRTSTMGIRAFYEAQYLMTKTDASLTREAKKQIYAIYAAQKKQDLFKVKTTAAVARTVVYRQHKPPTWKQWLQKGADHGSEQARKCLKNKKKAPLPKGNFLAGEKKPGEKFSPLECKEALGEKADDVRARTLGNGNVKLTMRNGDSVVICDDTVTVTGNGDDAVSVAATVAKKKFSGPIVAKGDDKFKLIVSLKLDAIDEQEKAKKSEKIMDPAVRKKPGIGR